MAIWHADIVLDLDWIVAHGGKIVEPKAEAQRLDANGRPIAFYVYGEGESISHLRVLYEADSDEEAQATVDSNIVLWREALTVTSVLTTSHYAAAATLGANSSAHIVSLGQGGVKTPFVQLNLQIARPVPADYSAAAALMAGWPADLAIHFHFLAKFLNPNLPQTSVGFKVIDFLNGTLNEAGANLQKNAAYRTFLDEHGGALDVFKHARQPRYGFMEEVRALMAHALLVDRPNREEQARAQHAATDTFSPLEGMITYILNEIAPEGMEFKPKPALEPPDAFEAVV